MNFQDFLRMDASELPDYPIVQRFSSFNADSGLFFARALEFVKAQTYDKKYPANSLLAMLPINTEGGAGIKTITYQSYDSTGVAKIIDSMANDLPLVGITGEEITAKVKIQGLAYDFNYAEVEAARLQGLPLQARKAQAVKLGIDQQANQIAAKGETEHGIVGLFTHPNITAYTLPTDGTGSSATFGSKTADQIIRDISGMINKVPDLTNGVEVVDTVLMPIAQYGYISTTPRSTTSDTTILQFLQSNNPGVTFKAEPLCKGAGTAGADLIFAFKNDNMHIELAIPHPFDQKAPQERNLSTIVNCVQHIAGVLNYYPLACIKASGC